MDVKAKYLLLDIKLLDVRQSWAACQTYSMRLGDDFDWLGDHSANQEPPEVSLRGSWMLCTPSLLSLYRSVRAFNESKINVSFG